jgi:hypothetical protein
MPAPAVPQFQLRQVYNFDLYAPDVLGAGFKGAQVMGLIDRETANKYIDTQAMHIQIFPQLPVGWPNNANAYDYVKIKTSAGNIVVLGLAWIKTESVELVGSQTITVAIANVAADDIPRVRNALIANGFANLAISIT